MYVNCGFYFSLPVSCVRVSGETDYDGRTKTHRTNGSSKISLPVIQTWFSLVDCHGFPEDLRQSGIRACR